MDNFLDNGTILPHGLLGDGERAAMAGFNKAYRNTQLRLGIVVAAYQVGNPDNLLKFTTEYDVLVFEQNENMSASVVRYRNCVCNDGGGSIADFLDKNLRIRSTQPTLGRPINTSGQNGSLVLIQCLDGMSAKAVIIGEYPHPDRPTTLKTTLPYLQGEYNGANLVINNDGSVTFTFKGATDNNGKPTDSSQGNTTVAIAKDGSFQIQHSTITFNLDRNGVANLTVKGDANITATGTTTVEGATVNLGKNASDAVIKGNAFQSYFNGHIHTTAVGPSGPPISPMPASTLSSKVKTE